MGGAALHTALYAFDAAFFRREIHPFFLCGVDEAGRGPLCGPVSVAAVILDEGRPLEGLNDSKKLSEKKRELLYAQIMESALAVCAVLVPPEEIDRTHILAATLMGMRQAVQGLSVRPHLVLADGNRAPDIPVECRTVTKGDAQSACIAAASIVAKVTRDRHMLALDARYPQYQLARHKGYGTKLHYEMLRKYGAADFYRQSFLRSFYDGKHP